MSDRIVTAKRRHARAGEPGRGRIKLPTKLFCVSEQTKKRKIMMQKQEPNRVLAAVSDLFFSVKLTEAAKRAGLALEFVKEPKDLLEKAAALKPSLIVFDLNFEALQPLKLIGKLKGKAETRGISLIGYLSHIQAELKQQAHEAGCDMVLARSAFSQNLPVIFKRHSGSV